RPFGPGKTPAARRDGAGGDEVFSLTQRKAEANLPRGRDGKHDVRGDPASRTASKAGIEVGARMLSTRLGRLRMSAYPVSHMVTKRLWKRSRRSVLRPSLLALAVAA